jgi:hypothetical protein
LDINSSTIYDELLSIKVDLDFDSDPTPSVLQDKIIECNAAMRKVEKRMIEVTRELSLRDKELKIEQSRVEVKKRSLLLNDTEIKKLPTGKERESAADGVMEDDHKKILALGNKCAELQSLFTAIKLVQQNLRTTNSDIRMLIRIMEQQISRLNIGTRDDKEVRDLMDGLSEVEELENEMTLDDVESSFEGDEAKKPDSSTDVEALSHTATSTEGAGSLEAEIELSLLSSEKTEEVSQSKGGPKAPTVEVSSESDGEELDALSSFLTEDDTDTGVSEEDDDDESEDRPAQSAVVVEGEPINTAQDVGATEAAGDSSGGSEDGGLNIDLGDILGEESPATPPVEVKPKKTAASAEPSAESKKAPVSQEKPKSAAASTDFDIEDLIGSLDI